MLVNGSFGEKNAVLDYISQKTMHEKDGREKKRIDIVHQFRFISVK